jgi:hypothetical protein
MGALMFVVIRDYLEIYADYLTSLGNSKPYRGAEVKDKIGVVRATSL